MSDTTQSHILAASLIQSIISDNDCVRGNVGVAYGGVSNAGKQFYHVLKYAIDPYGTEYMETVYEGSFAMDAADAYCRMAGVMIAYRDAVTHHRTKNRITIRQNV